MLNSQLLFDLSWWMVFDLEWRAFHYGHISFCSVCPKIYCPTSVIICFQEANIEQWPILLTPCNKRKCCNHLFHHDWAWCKRFLCISLCFEPSRADPDYGERVMISHDKQYNKTCFVVITTITFKTALVLYAYLSKYCDIKEFVDQFVDSVLLLRLREKWEHTSRHVGLNYIIMSYLLMQTSKVWNFA